MALIGVARRRRNRSSPMNGMRPKLGLLLGGPRLLGGVLGWLSPVTHLDGGRGVVPSGFTQIVFMRAEHHDQVTAPGPSRDG